MKVESVEEFLKRGGKVTVVPAGKFVKELKQPKVEVLTRMGAKV